MESRYHDMFFFSIEYLFFCLILLFVMLIIKSVLKKKNSGLITGFTVLVIISAIRVNTGSDYFNYYSMYNNSIRYYNSVSDIFRSGFQQGYMVLSYLVKQTFENEFFIFFVCAVIINSLIFYIISKYSPYPLLSVSLYLFMGYFLISLNILKQSLAMSVMFLAVIFFLKKRYLLFTILCLISTYFHITALVFVAILLIAKFTKVRLSLNVLYLSVFFSFLVLPFSNVVFKLAANISIFSKYQMYLESPLDRGDMRFIVNVLFFVIIHTIILHIIIKNIQNGKIKINNFEYILLKVMIIGLMLSIVSLRLYYINRISYYCFQLLILLIPLLVSKLSKIEIRTLVRKKIIMGLMVYSLIFTVLSGENNYYNYSTIFNDLPVSVMDFVGRGGRK
ncbi:EpsG family protein [Vagococcus carniphilus]|uniref:EpsG family protein n=1 Tax=Vagococcus carniphilus TaxID=218144 RepID=A0A430B8S1_9ENTE|nr:EpsG family protein [Vagococcus carniphilus]QNN73745.1 EpsG family protein [Vagococcus carniphilus]RSU16730.1 hypothetical protein CBF28_00665 [Vagococcus carniphilus]